MNKVTGSVGAVTEFAFEFTTINKIPEGGNVRVAFEDDAVQPPAGDPTDMLCETPDQSMTFDCSYVLYPSGLI